MNRFGAPHKSGGLAYWTFAVALIGAGFAVGDVWSAHFLHALRPSILHIQHIAQSLHHSGSVWLSIWTVFWNNARVALLMMGLGVFAGVFPIFTMWTNGLMMGVVTHSVAAHAHVAAWKVVLFGEMPHGILELTALCWACACGLRLAVSALRSVWTLLAKGGTLQVDTGVLPVRTEQEADSGAFLQELRFVVGRIPLILAILWVAACVEILVTPHLIHAFVG